MFSIARKFTVCVATYAQCLNASVPRVMLLKHSRFQSCVTFNYIRRKSLLGCTWIISILSHRSSWGFLIMSDHLFWINLVYVVGNLISSYISILSFKCRRRVCLAPTLLQDFFSSTKALMLSKREKNMYASCFFLPPFVCSLRGNPKRNVESF